MLFYILTLVYSTPFDFYCKAKCKKVEKCDRKITIAEFFYKSLADEVGLASSALV